MNKHLNGTVDLHVHAASRGEPQYFDALTIAQNVAQAGGRAVLLKSHWAATVELARTAEQACAGMRVFGSLVMNAQAGGLSPAVVEAALRAGAREIWMPTITAAHDMQVKGTPGKGITILDETGKILPEVHEILGLIARHNTILGTGHLSISEIKILVGAARAAGVRRILVTHPELPVVAVPLEVQEELKGEGLFFERCFLGTISNSRFGGYPLDLVVSAIRQIGVDSTVLATDLGQSANMLPAEGMRRFIDELIQLGFTEAQIDRMARQNPAGLLDF